MRFAIFLYVALTVAVVTISIGLALTGSPNWHFTILDVVADVTGGVIFALVAQALSSHRALRRKWIRVGIVALTTTAGIVCVLTLEGGAASALIFGS